MAMPDLPGRQAALFVNANARRGRAWFGRARDTLIENGFELRAAKLFRSGKTMDAAIREARDAKLPLIVVGGGDGTLNRAARWLALSDSVLGVLPLGTGNAFARDLGIRTDLASACETLAEGEVAKIDLGIIGNEPFLNVATVGLSALVARRLKPSRKSLFGPLAYLGPVLQSARIVRPFGVRITTPENVDEFESLQVVIGNGRYHAGPFELPSAAGLQSGELIVYAIASTKKSVLVRYALNLWRGRLEEMNEVRVYRMGHGSIETDPRKRIVVDGERLGFTPADFRIVPGALKVLAPTDIPGAITTGLEPLLQPA